jgi:hypothetical protein
MGIPKIIHQTAPNNRQDWHPMWNKCHDSWKNHFDSFEHIFWNDDDINSLVEKYYPKYYEMYCSFPIHIMKIDFARFCMLDYMGGIYADMDMFCYSNFYDELVKDAYLVENIKDREPLENSLMAGIPKNSFFQECMRIAEKRLIYSKKYNNLYNNIKVIHNNFDEAFNGKSFLVFYITGTNLVTAVYNNFDKNYVGTLSGWRYNNLEFSYDKEFKTKHMHTLHWGLEDRKKVLHKAKENNTSFEKQSKNDYKDLRLIDLENFDFYFDYSKGDYPKTDLVNFSYNNYENEHFSFEAIYN